MPEAAQAQLRNVQNYRWPDSEVPRTAERLRDVTGVAIAATAYVVEGSMNGRTPRDTGEIIAGIMRRNLIPNEWLTNQVGVLRTPTRDSSSALFTTQLNRRACLRSQ